MIGTPIDLVKFGIRSIHAELMADPTALECIYISIITFASKAQQIVPLTELGSFVPPDIKAGGVTSFGAALKLLMEAIDREVQSTTPDNKGDWKPLIFIFSDGDPTDHWEAHAATVKARRWSDNLIAIACGDKADPAVLKHCTETVLVMKEMTPDAFKQLFRWVSASIKKTSSRKMVEPRPHVIAKSASWKNLPTKTPWCPLNIAAQAPELRKVIGDEIATCERVVPGWRAACASRRGRMHANSGTHREDAFACDAHDRATVLCVSDGAGAYQHSRIGSHVAASRVVEVLMKATRRVDPTIAAKASSLKVYLTTRLTAAVLDATDAVIDLAKRSGCNPKDFRCTLLTALHYRGEQHELLLTNQIGDGAICLLRKDQSTARLGSRDSGAHSGEVSCFVPDDCARVKAKVVDCITPVEPIECVLLCSDGVEDPFYPLEKHAAEIFRQLYRGVQRPLPDFKTQPAQTAPLLQKSAISGLVKWLEFEKRGENDDRTIAVLHRTPVTHLFAKNQQTDQK